MEVAAPCLGALYGRALQMTRRRDEAQDLVQDTCLRAYRFFHRFRPGSNFQSWSFTILRNLWINRLRKWRRRPQFVDPELLAQIPAAPSFDAESDFGDEVHAALLRLPHRLRFPIVLHSVHRMSYAEIARELRWPLGTVMSRLHRGRRKLRRELAAYGRAHGYGVAQPPPAADASRFRVTY